TPKLPLTGALSDNRMEAEKFNFKQSISYILAMCGGVSLAICSVLLIYPWATYGVFIIPIVFVATSMIFYKRENGIVSGVIFTFFVGSLWAGACYLIFIPIGFWQSTEGVQLVAYVVSMLVGLLFILLALQLGSKLKLLNKLSQQDAASGASA